MTDPEVSLSAKMGWNAIAVVFGSLTRLISAIFIMRFLGPDLSGWFATLTWLIEILVQLFSFGMPNTLTHFLSQKMGKSSKVALKKIITLGLLIGVVLSIASAFFAYALALYFLSNDQALIGLACMIAFMVATQLWVGLSQSILIGLHRFRTYSHIVIISSSVLLVGQIVGTIFWGLQGAMTGALISNIVSIVLILHAVAKIYPMSGKLILSKSISTSGIVAYARDAWLAGLISGLIWGKVEIFILNRFSNANQVGYFAAGMLFYSLLAQAVNLISSTFNPHFSQLTSEQRNGRINSDYKYITVFMALIIFPISLGGTIMLPEIVRLSLGVAYIDGARAAQWLMLSGFLTFATAGSAIIYGYGDAHIIRNWSISASFLVIPIYILLAPSYGAEGVACARFFIQSFFIILTFALLRKKYKIFVPVGDLASVLFASTVCAFSAYIVLNTIGGWLGIFLGILVGFSFYVYAIRTIRLINLEYQNTLLRLTYKLPFVMQKPFELIILLTFKK